MTLRSRLTLLGRDLANTDRRLLNNIKSNQLVLLRRLDSFDSQLRLVGPEQVLKRGYSITTNKKTGEVVRFTSQIKGGETIVTKLADGQIESTTDDPTQPKLFD
jgi:exodeoxyribonuclease VII large subunit